MRNATKVLLTVVLLFTIPLLYFGTYALLVRAVNESIEEAFVGPTRIVCVKRTPEYLVGGDASAFIFGPAYRLDRFLCPQFWMTNDEAPPKERESGAH
jgi:hypothetical protein